MMENLSPKLAKVKSIIESCETYEQLITCQSFLYNNYITTDISERFKIFGWIQKEVYKIRNCDLLEHTEKMKEIREKYSN